MGGMRVSLPVVLVTATRQEARSATVCTVPERGGPG